MNIVFSTSYFPNIEYVRKTLFSSYIYIENYEFYERHSYRNKTQILGANGIILLTVPIKKCKSNTIINKIEIADQKWQTNHIKSIKSAYGSAPYFIHYFPEIQNIINTKHKYLIDLNNHILNYIYKVFNINITIHQTKSYENQIVCYDKDFRFQRIKENNLKKIPPYQQVLFNHKNKIKHVSFFHNLSCLDILFNLGPNTHKYLQDLKIK